MLLPIWQKLLKRSKRTLRNEKTFRRVFQRSPLNLEALEDRIVPTDYVVTNVIPGTPLAMGMGKFAGKMTGGLASIVTDLNTNGNAALGAQNNPQNTITFSLGAGINLINLTATLAINRPVNINATGNNTSQVVLVGSSAVTTGLKFTNATRNDPTGASYSEVKGLNFINFSNIAVLALYQKKGNIEITQDRISLSGFGVLIEGTNNCLVENNQIFSCKTGVDVDLSSQKTTISNNNIALNSANGITVANSNQTTISNNWIGFNQAGVSITKSNGIDQILNNMIVSNRANGIQFDSVFNSQISKNTIVGNGSGKSKTWYGGILFDDSGNNTIKGNLIGLVTTGNNSAGLIQGNYGGGIRIQSAQLDPQNTNNQIIDNTISGNKGPAIDVLNATATTVKDNNIGLNFTQTGATDDNGASTGNRFGITIDASVVTVTDNRISANTGYAVSVAGTPPNKSKIIDNKIGTDPTGTKQLPNMDKYPLRVLPNTDVKDNIGYFNNLGNMSPVWLNPENGERPLTTVQDQGNKILPVNGKKRRAVNQLSPGVVFVNALINEDNPDDEETIDTSIVVTSLSTTTGSAAGGTSVTITGSGFTNVLGVSFGGLAASFTINSNTSITAVAPPSFVGTIDVTGQSASGSSALVDADQFTYTSVSAPTVTSLGATTGTTAGGTSVSISGTNLLGASDVFFGAAAATSFTVNSSTSITATAPAQYAGTYDVTVVTPGGGTSATSSNDQFTYTNSSAPNVSSLDVNTGTTAGQTEVNLTGTNFLGAIGVSFGSYAAPFMVNSATSITAWAPPQASGTVDITVTTYSGTSSTGSADQFTYSAGSAPTVIALALSGGYSTGGDSVIVVGSNFTGATAVTFGTTSASFAVLADNEIVANAPAHAAGTVDVTVTTFSGISTTGSADQYTYSAAPLPTVTGLSSDTGTTAGGDFLTITGTGFTNAYEVDFGGTPLYDFTVNSDTQITLFTPAAPAGKYDVRVDTDAGTSPTTSNDTFTYLAASAPAVTSLDVTTSTTAGGTVVNLTGTNFGGATDIFFGTTEATSFSVNSGTSITATAPAEAAGTVDVTVWTMTGSSATSANDTFAVTAASAPSVSSLTTTTDTTAGGTLVTINGSGFTSAIGVNFGSVAADYTVQSDSLITAYDPAQAAGTVDVTVTTFAGTSSTSSSDTFSYTNASAPSVSGLDVSTGPTSGGTTVTILGSGFTSATGVNFGSLSAASYVVNSDNSITAVTPLEAAGTVDVTVTTYSGTSSTSGADTFAFTNVTASAPAITALDIATGSTAGGQVVTLTGTNFSGTTAVEFGGSAASSYTVNADTSITATAPAGSAGNVYISVTTNNGTTSNIAADQFTYLSTPAPAITSLSSSSGTTAGNATITLTGTNFTSASAVNFGAFAATSYTVSSSTSIVAVTPALPVGSYGVVVVTPSGTSSATTYTVSAASLPSITSLGTNTSTTAGGTSVSITGTNFIGATDVFFGGVEASSFTVNSATSITAIAPPQYAGTYDVSVVSYAGTSALSSADRFGYTVASAPTVTSLGTTTGTTAGGTSVTITGTNLIDAFDVEFGNVSSDSFTVTSSTSVTAIAPAQYAGTVDVTVWTYAGTSASSSADHFTYSNASSPTVTALSTHTGTTAGGTVVTLTGTNFSDEATVSFGSVAAASVIVNSATSITAVAPVEAAATVHVTVTTYAATSATSSSDTFSITNASAPTVAAVTASSGSVLGGDPITITGSHFTGATGVSFNGNPAAAFTVLSDTAILAIDPAAAATGTIDVTVTTFAGTSSTGSPDHFTYDAVTAPTVTALSTSSGSTSGGTAVTITGTGFLNATEVDIAGSPVASFVILSDTSILAVTAPNTAGVFDLSVTASGLTSALNSSDRYTYSAATAPAVTSLGTTTGTTAGGTSVTITGTNFLGTGGVFFGGVAASSFVMNSSTSITAVSPSEAAGNVNVTVSTPTGTSAVSSSDTFTYTNASAPTVSALSLTTGTTAGGITVTLTGSHLTGVEQVLFGTVSADFTFLSDGYLTAVVPVHASGMVHVTVVTPSGTSATSGADEFTYTAAAAASITSVAADSGAPQGGNAIVVLGSGFTGASEVAFGSTAASYTVLSDNAILVTVPGPMSTGAVDITVTTPVGTSSPATEYANQYTFTGPLVLDGVNGLTVSGLTLADGVEIIDSTNITIENSTLGGNTSTGDALSIDGESSYITIYGNTIDANTEDGIYIDAGATNITIGGTGSGQSNELAENSGIPLVIGGSSVTVLNNTIGDNGAMGVDITDTASYVTIGGAATSDGNDITENEGTGVYVAGSQVTILGNTISDNTGGGDGIYVASTADTVTIGGASTGDGNTINGSENGIEIAGANVSVVDNTLSDNDNVDVLVDGGTNVTLNGNSMSYLTVSSGTVTVSGTNSITYVSVSGGTVTVEGSLTIGYSLDVSGGTLNVNSGATLDFDGDSFEFNGGIIALHGGTIEDSSTLYISSGATLEGAGTIEASVDNSGTIALGAPYTRGALTITGNYTQESSGVFNVKLDSSSLSDVDQVFIDGTATLGGTFNATLASGYTPTSGNVFEVLESSGISGSFSSINLPTYGGGSLSSSTTADDFKLTAS